MLKLISCSYKKFILFQTICTIWGILYAIAALIFPYAVSKVIDQVILNKKYSLVAPYLLVIVFSGLLMIVFNYIQYMSYYKFGQKSRLVIKQKIFKKLMTSGGGFRKTYSSGNILRLIEQDSERIDNLVGECVGQFMVNAIVILGVIILLLSKQVLIGGIMISISTLFAMFQIILSNSIKKETNDLRKELGEASSYTNEMIIHYEHIVTSGYVDRFRRDFGEKYKNIMYKDISQMKKNLVGGNIGIAYNVISNIVTLGIGIIEIQNGNMTVGALLALTMYVQRLYSPLLSISNSYFNIKKLVPFIEKILEFLEDEDFIIDGKYIPKTRMQGRICFDGINFGYDGDNILENFNLNIEEKKITGIIGENGSGKSTLIKILLKIYKNRGGHLYIDGIDINSYSNNYLYSNISVMFQNSILISGK